MKPTVYIETSIVGYLTIRPPKDERVVGHIADTKLWWENARGRFEVYTSQLVVDEASAGDPQAAAERSRLLNELEALPSTEMSDDLADRLLVRGALPIKARADAQHVAIAAIHGIDFLLTWNCRHLANAALRKLINEVCRDEGFEPPIICTPPELTEE